MAVGYGLGAARLKGDKRTAVEVTAAAAKQIERLEARIAEQKKIIDRLTEKVRHCKENHDG